MKPCAKCRESVDRHLDLTYQQNKMLQSQVDHMTCAINHAITAMDKGEYGSVRRILKSGTDKPPMVNTGVIAKDGVG